MSGFFTFKWAYPAGEVYVTGTFDNWKQSTKLEKEGEAFVAKVELPVKKTLYKFVVDGTWVVDQSARKELEGGFENNLLIPEDIVAEQPETEMSETEMSAATISSAAPESTTAALAAAVPLENTTFHDATISSAAPESSTAELAGAVHTPGPTYIPGSFIVTPADTPAAESVDPITAEKKKAQEFFVKAFPASDTPTNPFTLAPGEPIPVNEFTTQDLNKHVKLDAESYEKADASNLGFGPGGAPILPDVVTPAAQREAEGRGVLDIPVATTNIIPESSLPITSFAAATTAPQVPEAVKESQEKAEVEPEASAIPEAVEQKKEVEEELKAKAPVTQGAGTVEAESHIPAVATATTVAGIMAAAGISSASGESNDETTPVIPEPEASAVEAAVEAKKEYKQELQKEVHEIAPVALNSAPIHYAISEPTEPVVEVPEVVQKSQDEAGALPGASGVSGTVGQKKEELKAEVKPTETTPSIPPTVPNGVVSNGNATEAKSEKGVEANGNGFKPPKKSFENSDDRDLKKSKKRTLFSMLFSTLKEFLRFGTGTKEKGKAKGDNREGGVMLRNSVVLLAVTVSAFWLFLALLNSMGWGVASVPVSV